MAEPEAVFRLVPGTRRTEGRAGNTVIVADRPEGRAGGTGMGLNGGQVLALAIGTCFSNDLQFVADEMGAKIADVDLEVSITWGGQPNVAQSVVMTVAVELTGGGDPSALIDRAAQICTIANTLKSAVAVTIRHADQQ